MRKEGRGTSTREGTDLPPKEPQNQPLPLISQNRLERQERIQGALMGTYQAEARAREEPGDLQLGHGR